MSERGTDLERDELVARLAEALAIKEDAESWLRVRAKMAGEKPDKERRRDLLQAARKYAVADEAVELVAAGHSVKELWGDGFAMADALAIARDLRDARLKARETRRKAEEQIAAEGLAQLERAAGAK